VERLEFLRRFCRGEAFDAWLDEVRGRGYRQGGRLVYMLGSPWQGLPGLPDNVATADSFLVAAEAEGLIKRVSHDPTVELRFFGCGGLPVRWGKPTSSSRPVEFGWCAV
jgi:hypothetical protein